MVATAVSRPAKIEPIDGGVGQPGGGVHGVTDHGVRQRRLHAGQHLAGVEPDPQAEPATAAELVGDQPADFGCMLTAARTARSASSSWAVGAPKTAMMPSPVSLSTWPPTSTTTRANAASTRSVTSPTRSGSRSSAHAVKSERSPNSTVTTRRSAAFVDPLGRQRHPAVVAEPCSGDRRGRAGGAAQRSGGRRRHAGAGGERISHRVQPGGSQHRRG